MYFCNQTKVTIPLVIYITFFMIVFLFKSQRLIKLFYITNTFILGIYLCLPPDKIWHKVFFIVGIEGMAVAHKLRPMLKGSLGANSTGSKSGNPASHRFTRSMSFFDLPAHMPGGLVLDQNSKLMLLTLAAY